MKRLLHTPLALLLRRIALLYAVLMLCRVVFYLYNAQLLGTIGRGELWQLLAGALKFDTASVVYANGIFVLLALLPLHVRERGWYRKLMYWYYVAVNAVLVVAVGCTGGRHRSVSIARAVTEYLNKLGYAAYENHRDITRG